MAGTFIPDNHLLRSGHHAGELLVTAIFFRSSRTDNYCQRLVDTVVFWYLRVISSRGLMRALYFRVTIELNCIGD